MVEGVLAQGEFEPRFVDVPRRRRAQLAAERNLKWGLAILLLAFGLIGAALIVSGPRSLVPIVICLVTLTILWTMARLRLFHQRNGVFFATALVCLLGASIPMIERGYVELDRMAHAAPSTTPAAAVASAPSPIVPKLAPVPEKAPEPVAAFEPDPDLPSLVDALKIPEPTDPNAKLVRIIENAKVTVGRKPYLLNAGDIFVFEERKNGQVTFHANELHVSVPDRIVEMMAPPAIGSATVSEPATLMPATPPPQRRLESHVSDRDLDGASTARAQEEAVRRYPGIGVKGSPENAIFIEQFQKLKAERPEFFDDEQWPLYLAEGVAKEHGWVREK